MDKYSFALKRSERAHQKIKAETPLPDESFQMAHSESTYSELVPKRISFLKTKLLRGYRAESIKTIMFTGTSHKCGTTTTAVSLGTMLANEAGYKVLLVDTNVRNPGLHSVFNTELNGGICELIGGKTDKTFQFKQIGPAKLYFVPCGVFSGGTKRHFDSPRFESFLNLAREKFDFVLLDSAPIENDPDPHSICAKVDGVVMVITSGKTRRQVVQRIKKEVENAGGTILGIVIGRREYYISELDLQKALKWLGETG